jgi:hypothetical protein
MEPREGERHCILQNTLGPLWKVDYRGGDVGMWGLDSGMSGEEGQTGGVMWTGMTPLLSHSLGAL